MQYLKRLWVPGATKTSAAEFNRMEAGIAASQVTMVVAATALNVNLAALPGTIGAVVNPTTFLLLGQTNRAENGVYQRTPLQRLAGWDTADDFVPGRRVHVISGTYASKRFVVTQVVASLGLTIVFGLDSPWSVSGAMTGVFSAEPYTPGLTYGIEFEVPEEGKYSVQCSVSQYTTAVGASRIDYFIENNRASWQTWYFDQANVHTTMPTAMFDYTLTAGRHYIGPATSPPSASNGDDFFYFNITKA